MLTLITGAENLSRAVSKNNYNPDFSSSDVIAFNELEPVPSTGYSVPKIFIIKRSEIHAIVTEEGNTVNKNVQQYLEEYFA